MVEAAGVRLHLVEAGPPAGAPVVLLHGFPEFHFGWRHQIDALAAAGYRVLAPDQRGYNLSDKPRGLAAYSLDMLAADVAALLDGGGHQRAFVVGHDWGGAVAWWLAVTRPERVAGLVSINAPHPAVMRRFLRYDRAQRRRSRYIFFFQLPWLPEYRLRRNDFAESARALTATSRPGTFSPGDLERYREAWRQPGTPTGMLNWYRAALRRPPRRPPSARVTVPTLIVWGERDRFLRKAMAAPSAALCDRVEVEVIPGATHWVQHEEPAKVNRLLLDFFVRVTTAGA
jgi:pimeloyl-ACP methyl ester carboxylesterase